MWHTAEKPEDSKDKPEISKQKEKGKGKDDPKEKAEDADITTLLNSKKKGDFNRGLQKVIKRYGPGVCGFMRLVFPGLRADEIADAWTNVLLALWRRRKRRRFRPGSLAPLLFKIARRKAIDALRGQRPKFECIDEGDEEEHVGFPVYDPLETSELLAVILEGIREKLTPVEVVVLSKYAELVFAGHARWTGTVPPDILAALVNADIRPKQLSPDEVDLMLKRLRLRLREFLARKGYLR